MSKTLIYFLAFLVKGWEVSLLLLLPFIQQQLGITILQVGILSMFLSLFYVLTALFAGHLSEKIGNKGVIGLSIACYGLAWVGISLGNYFPVLVVVYSLAGIGSGIFMPIANSIIAQISDKERGKELGNFSAIADLGRVFFSSSTAILFTVLGLFNLSLLFGLMTIVLIALLFFFHLSSSKKNSETEQSVKQSVKIFLILKNKKYLLSVITGIIDSFSSSSLYIFIPFLLLPKGIEITAAGFLTALFFLGYLLGRLLLGRLSDKHGVAKVLIISQVLMAVLIISLVIASNFYLVAAILFILGIVTRGTSPIIRAMVGDSVENKAAFGKAYSFYSFSVNSSSVGGRPLFGFIAGILGINAVFYFAGLVSLLVIIPIYLYNTALPNKVSPS